MGDGQSKEVCVALGAAFLNIELADGDQMELFLAKIQADAVVDAENCALTVEWWEVAISAILLLMSGLFSGLTLGLLGLDPTNLEIVQASGNKDAEYAAKIAPLRKRGNLLLCTLLLGNVAVNAALAVLLADMSSGLMGFLLSTVLIVIFGEIVPQATCSRYALLIGAKTVWIVKILMVLMFPITWPIAKALDLALGEELGQIYSTKELMELILIHAKRAESNLEKETGTIIQGALSFQGKTCRDVMTKWEDVYMQSEDAVLNFDILTQIFKSGHSRVPCYYADPQRGHRVTGLLFVKDLILLDPEDEVPISAILDVFDHPVLHVWPDYELDKLLNDFCTGRSHLAIVRDVVNDDPNRDPYYVNRGLVTLEDLLEIILQRNIVDETDVYIDVHSKDRKRARPEFDLSKLSIFDYRPNAKMSMSPQEVNAVFNHLRAQCSIFKRGTGSRMPDRALKNLLSSGEVIKIQCEDIKDERQQRDPYKLIDDDGLLLYQRGIKTRHFCLILDGKVEVHAGKQGFRCELARWTILCPEVLERVIELEQKDDHDGQDSHDSYVPDFTCKVIKNSRVLRISTKIFLDALKGKFDISAVESRKTKGFDTTGDGRTDAWALDTSGDGVPDTLLRKVSTQNLSPLMLKSKEPVIVCRNLGTTSLRTRAEIKSERGQELLTIKDEQDTEKRLDSTGGTAIVEPKHAEPLTLLV